MKLPGVVDKENCCGCRACVEICPKNAISMKEDNYGFVYPVIEEDKCIHCGQCEKVCPTIVHPVVPISSNKAIVAVHKDEHVRSSSASGGAFSALCTAWGKLHPEAYVCGVKWDGHKAVHDVVRVDSPDVEKFMKSKYVMADTNGIFQKIKRLLGNEKFVLFSGTPCQCAALRNYVGLDMDHLLIVDIVCHGAPNSKILRMHIKELELQKKQDILCFGFRDKTEIKGKISSRSVRVELSNGSAEHFEINEDAYLQLYYNRLAYRSSCGQCYYAQPERVSDITICDAHHINELYSDLNVEIGVSEILFHSEKGRTLEEKVEKLVSIYPITYDWAVNHNKQLVEPTTIHPKTEKFYEVLNKTGSFSFAVKKALYRNLAVKVLSKIQRNI